MAFPAPSTHARGNQDNFGVVAGRKPTAANFDNGATPGLYVRIDEFDLGLHRYERCAPMTLQRR
jgi:hypothetical protein